MDDKRYTVSTPPRQYPNPIPNHGMGRKAPPPFLTKVGLITGKGEGERGRGFSCDVPWFIASPGEEKTNDGTGQLQTRPPGVRNAGSMAGWLKRGGILKYRRDDRSQSGGHPKVKRESPKLENGEIDHLSIWIILQGQVHDERSQMEVPPHRRDLGLPLMEIGLRR
ncbi:hypothetical protein BO70DRAFT_174741 [Aspergillus heteromorphus CBS 117.55]|uniref:Uncharacterized protein n=1 Tax=Aspergillus heteromorphus CBS 117.55 TaxID=1448321 RepID=A0A317UYQ7_9EURO|nr:uncharacterized protein BO70DRAFT_174741 [Aspergillus heteromorphus CBS 117.55]PWY66078.1 hypothetical protein BO70DRAFT_174741 [Aspergillus heteromorphus CBS 117.55]